MRFKYAVQISVVAALSSVFLTENSSSACEYRTPIQASSETRTYRNTEIGFSVEIPENYRLMGINQGNTILVAEPSTYDFLQCIYSSGRGADTPEITATIDIRPVSPTQSSNLYNLVVQQYPWIENEGFSFKTGDFFGTQAILYFQNNLVDGGITQYISIRSLDRRHLITISGSEQDPEFDAIGDSFRLQ
jgi:hypothetical protein